MLAFLVAVAVVILSMLYMFVSLQDVPVERGDDTVGQAIPAEAASDRGGSQQREGPDGVAHERGALNIFFGSQAGTAETFAKKLARLARFECSALPVTR